MFLDAEGVLNLKTKQKKQQNKISVGTALEYEFICLLTHANITYFPIERVSILITRNHSYSLLS